MTRETRIGLLVGLAFIVMFGLILSELMSSKLPPASGEPNKDSAGDKNAGTAKKSPGEASRAAARAGDRGGGLALSRESDRSRTGSGSRGGMLKLAATGSRSWPQMSESLSHLASNRSGTAARATTAKAITHKVREGENLTRIAERYYGPKNGDKYTRIFEANRHILPDASTVIVGQVLVIPPLTDDSPPARRTAPAEAVGQVEMDLSGSLSYSAAEEADRAAGELTYVVQKGDVLSAIAKRYLGDAGQAAVMRIFNANSDKLASPDELQVGVELVIPR
ncbi:MAG: LysM peptidoglycan-binding domain-containing protein [Planctomycetota bacterium]|jgi:nucleoid-associated protein YgaU